MLRTFKALKTLCCLYSHMLHRPQQARCTSYNPKKILQEFPITRIHPLYLVFLHICWHFRFQGCYTLLSFASKEGLSSFPGLSQPLVPLQIGKGGKWCGQKCSLRYIKQNLFLGLVESIYFFFSGNKQVIEVRVSPWPYIHVKWPQFSIYLQKQHSIWPQAEISQEIKTPESQAAGTGPQGRLRSLIWPSSFRVLTSLFFVLKHLFRCYQASRLHLRKWVFCFLLKVHMKMLICEEVSKVGILGG